MTCDHVEERLSAYRDGELNPVLRERVRAHLRHCGCCGADARAHAALDSRVSLHLSLEQDPEYLTLAVMRRLPAMPPAHRRGSLGMPVGPWRMNRWVIGLACVAAQAAALGSAYWYGARQGNSTDASRPPTSYRRVEPRGGSLQLPVRRTRMHSQIPGASEAQSRAGGGAQMAVQPAR